VVDAPDGQAEQAYEEVFYPADRIPFVDWEEFSGAQPAVVLTGVTTLLAFVTGLSNLSAPVVSLNGPLAPYVPATTAVARLAGVTFAFLLAPVTVGLQRRKRLAWRVAMVLLPALAVLPLTTLATTDIPLLLAGGVTVPLLVRNREAFDQSLDLSPLQIASLLSVAGVVAYGTVGAYGLQEHFNAIADWVDALYFVIITIATVGYGDITPTTQIGEFFSLSIVILGTGAFTAAVGALVVPAIESRMAAAFGNMTPSELRLLENHVVVLGYGDLTESLLDSLADETDVVVVTPDEDTAADLDAESVNVLTGDPTDEEILERAQVDSASGVVVASGDDATDVLAVIAARNVNPDVRTVAGASEAKHVDKLASVGADQVINPHTIGGRLLGESVLDESASSSVVAALETSED
jgi:voltage-gated potassium channel